MTDQEINIAIARWMGWTQIREDKISELVGCPPNEDSGTNLIIIPDFCHDLNAMHEAEEHLTFNQSGVYEGYLDTIKDRPFLIDGSCPHAIWHLEAKDRAEALLRTIGQWKD